MNRAPAVLLTAAVWVVAGCGGDEPAPVDDDAAIRSVLVENELGGAERCLDIYTQAYLAENWNKHVTSIPGETPLDKCNADEPLPGITEDDLKIKVESIDGDSAIASTQVRAEFPVGFALIRDGETWKIDGFSD